MPSRTVSRLRDGTSRDSDIVLVEHEFVESATCATTRESYREAHSVAFVPGTG